MGRIPYSYEQELKEQIDERLAAITRIHRADLVDGTHLGARHPLSSRLGGALIRLGTWLERSGQTMGQVSS